MARRRPLYVADRRKLAVGVLRRFRDGDDVASVAERMKQPETRVHEALDEHVARVRSEMGGGVNADDIAKATGYPRPFITYVMRRTFAEQGHGGHEPSQLRLGDARNNPKQRLRADQVKRRKKSRVKTTNDRVDIVFDTLADDIRKLLEDIG